MELVWDAQCDVAESPVWDEEGRRILFADMFGGRILSYNIDTGSRQEWALGDVVGSFGLCKSGRAIVALARRVVFLDLKSGEVVPFTGELDEPEENRFNDGRPGPDGCYWVGTVDGRWLSERASGRPAEQPAGSLYRILPNGTMERRAEGYGVFNSLAFSADGLKMYASKEAEGESKSRVLERWDFDPITGSTRNYRVLSVVGEEQGRPDGAAMDDEGCYWTAGPSAGRLNRYTADGELLDQLVTPFPAPTMLCFGGGSLFVTTLRRKELALDAPYEHKVGGLFRTAAPSRGAPVDVFNDT
jgi:sugar lactone lactonase YvrE